MDLLLNMSIFSHKVDKSNHKNSVNTPRENRCSENKKLVRVSHHCYTDKFVKATNRPSGSKSNFFPLFYRQLLYNFSNTYIP